MEHITISELRKRTTGEAISASFDAQLERREERETKGGKPYYEIFLVDGGGELKLKIWENKPQFKDLANKNEDAEIKDGGIFRFSGDWTQNQYGVDSGNWEMQKLSESEAMDFLSGDPATRERQDADWEDILRMTGGIEDPRLHEVCRLFIEKFGKKFRRAAAARKNHHARRGGLVEHVAQMMRSAQALCGVYRGLNCDLLTAGVLFHDCGKMWENNYSESGFTQPYDLHGEMLGHIPIGIELLGTTWREMIEGQLAKGWGGLVPTTAEVKLHLQHLIASHHGTHEWGSPTLPRTPEAMVLHYVDNLDAKFEMMRMGYESSPELAPGIQQRQFPLPAGLVKPLSVFEPEVQSGEVVESAPE